jgi:hypothetical protein
MSKEPTAATAAAGRRARTASPEPPRAASTRTLALPVACGIVLLGFGLLGIRTPGLFATFAGAGIGVLAWTAWLHRSVVRSGRTIVLEAAVRKHHWVQACAQTAVLLYWGWHVRFVYAFLPLIVAQLVFAYAVDSLLTLTRRDRYPVGFGPFPVILSINLFLWFRPEWFFFQFAMILVGYLAKELIRWERDGRSAHIFNPSSFPLAVASVGLILASASDITLGTAIATTQFYPPHMYAAIFLVSLPGQILFGVARMTMAAVVSLFLISELYLRVTGTYLFFDAHIPLPVFLGMHLLFTDPSTSPRSGRGRIAFGALYAVGTASFYSALGAFGVPTFYDKLLPVPLMNLLVRRIDRIAAATRRPDASAAPTRRLRPNLGWTALWACIFLGLTAVRGIGDRHPGQALPFWTKACRAGVERACAYEASMLRIYCGNGSGWACNEWGVTRLRAGAADQADLAFARACATGFDPGCANRSADADAAAPARAAPRVADLPIVLRGTRPPLTDRDPARLHAIACEQGWPGACARPPAPAQ